MIIVTCKCGCPLEKHRHYRPGSDCGTGHKVRCLSWRPRLRRVRVPEIITEEMERA